ncbi:MAG: hypothetical protein OSJ83_05580 [Clostridia bacterium]|nr:hypothetical protein [Clostridia bacterium]
MKKVCHKEAMKIISELNDKKTRLINTELREKTVRYRDGESRPTGGYSYQKTRDEIKKLDAEIRRIKHVLAKANCAVMLDGFDMTLGEGLVYLAQLTQEHERIDALANEMQTFVSITANGVTIHNDCMYDVKKAEADAAALNSEIGRLQVAIDRANLVNYIEL